MRSWVRLRHMGWVTRVTQMTGKSQLQESSSIFNHCKWRCYAGSRLYQMNVISYRDGASWGGEFGRHTNLFKVRDTAEANFATWTDYSWKFCHKIYFTKWEQKFFQLGTYWQEGDEDDQLGWKSSGSSGPPGDDKAWWSGGDCWGWASFENHPLPPMLSNPTYPNS